MFCIQCGHEIPKNSEFCTECGTKIQATIEQSEGFCTECGVMLPESSAFCADCGAKAIAQEDESFCTECGHKLSDDSDFCPSCGAKTNAMIENDENLVNTDTSYENFDNVSYVEIDNPITLDIEPLIDIPLENKPVSPAEMPLWEEEALSEIELDEPQEIDSYEVKKQRKLVTGLFGVTITLLVVVVGLVIFIMVNRGDEGRIGGRSSDQYEYDPTAGMTPEEYHIHRIYTGNLPAHPNVEIGPAMENFFTSHPEWRSWEDDPLFYVDVHGDALIDGETTTVQFIFRFSQDSSIFAPAFLIIYGSFQDIELMHEMLNNIMLGIR